MARVSLEEFAAQIMAIAGSPDRVAAGAARVVENPIAIGPLRVGPGGVAKATAIGYLGEIRGRAADEADWDVVLEVPVRVGVDVRFTRQRFKFGIEIMLRARIRMVPTTGCTVTVDVDEITEADITAKIDAHDLPAKVVSLGYNIELDVVQQVIAHANKLAASQRVMAARHIKVAEVIDRAWELGAILEHPAHAMPAQPPIEEPPTQAPMPPEPIEVDDSAPSYEHQPTLPLELPPPRHPRSTEPPQTP
ncbi:MAG: hypothetical protein ACRDQ7_21415 [Haloechinothrix sp.]